MAYRNKTYVCFDGDEDIKYYRLMTAWKANDSTSFNFHDAHDLNTARDSSQEESIKRQLRIRFQNSKTFIVLVGQRTRFLTKFVKWEMEVAQKLGLPIIVVNLNGSRQQSDLCPPAVRDKLAIHIPFGQKIIQHAMDNWPSSYETKSKEGLVDWYYYTDKVYQSLGL
ncbi:MAG: TIR domain-containing protein [Pseudomonadota bacterium]